MSQETITQWREKVKAVVEKATDWHGYYDEAKALLPEWDRQFVDTSSWAGENHAAKRRELIEADLTSATIELAQNLLGDDEYPCYPDMNEFTKVGLHGTAETIDETLHEYLVTASNTGRNALRAQLRQSLKELRE